MPDAAPDLPLRPPPPGDTWAVGVSGGADSVALLLAVRRQHPDLRLHVVHLNHETRGAESDADAAFVEALSSRLGIPCTIALRSAIEPSVPDLPSNPSARYRALRHGLFRQVCTDHALSGILLAHHADDQAETVLHRLLRGSGLLGLAAISPDATVAGLRIVRPLLDLRCHAIRQWLTDINEPWREDASNASDQYLRNRIRQTLAGRDDLVARLLDVGRAASTVRQWARDTAPALADPVDVRDPNTLPPLLADVAVRRWLASRGVPADDIDPAVVARVLRLAADAASPPTVNLPGSRVARRRAGTITIKETPTR